MTRANARSSQHRRRASALPLEVYCSIYVKCIELNCRMTTFDLRSAIQRAERRLGHERRGPASTRRRRSDRGKSRLPAPVLRALASAWRAHDRPGIAAMQRQIAPACKRTGRNVPSRATLYALMARAPVPTIRVETLPQAVRATLYNLDGVDAVPAHQLAFHCFQYGDLAAASYAAGLPWLALYQAARLRGWRPRNRGLLRAAMRARKI